MLPEALPYHLKVRDHFRQHPSTWEFFGNARTREEQWVYHKTEMLENTSPFHRETDAGLYAQIDLAREKLGLGQLTVTAYQAQYANEPELNAGIVYLHQEAHLVFSGPVRQRLNEAEMLAVIAHELSHVRLYTLLDGELEIADRIITAITNNAGNSDAPYYETARLFKSYTEIFCDRGAYAVVGDADAVITGILKMATGLSEVNPESYPNFIRTRALRLWREQQDQAEPVITRMIEGLTDLDRLDLFAQASLHRLTRQFIQELLQPAALRSVPVVGLAEQYFAELSWAVPGENDLRERLDGVLAGSQSNIHNYFSYLLLDFALADPLLEEQLMGRALVFAEEMGLSAVYEPICKKELQLSDKKWQQYKSTLLHGTS